MQGQSPGGPASVRPAAPLSRPGTPAAAAAIWNWREAATGPNRAKEATAARKEGFIRALIAGAIGTAVFFFWHRELSFVIWGIATITLLASALSPLGAYAAIQRGIEKLAAGIGIALSWLLLPLLFYLFVMPFGRLARRGMNDKMLRWFEPNSASYWHQRNNPPRSEEFYRRQF